MEQGKHSNTTDKNVTVQNIEPTIYNSSQERRAKRESKPSKYAGKDLLSFTRGDCVCSETTNSLCEKKLCKSEEKYEEHKTGQEGASGLPESEECLAGTMVMEVAMQAGHILLENGAEIFRVEETIDRICRYYGISSGNAFVLSNGIFATTGSEREQYFARVQHIPVSGVHLNRVAAVNQLSREIEEGKYTIEEVRHCLDLIRTMPGKTKRMQILASGIGSGCFCYLFGGDFTDSAAALLAGLCLYVFVLNVSAPHLSKIMGNIMGGALVTFLCMMMFHMGFGNHLDKMIIGAIIPLIPGVAFTNAIRDIADEDYISGSVRMLDALLVFFCIALGVGLVYTIYHRITGGVLL